MVSENNIFIKNIEAIKENCPFLDSEKFKPTTMQNIEIIPCRDNNKTLAVTSNNRTLHIHSKYYPIREAEKQVEELLPKSLSNHFTVLVGVGLGYLPKLLRSKIKEENKIIIIEPNYDILSYAINTMDWSDLFSDPRFFFIVVDTVETFRSNLYSIFMKEDIGTYTLHIDPIYSELFPENILNIANIISREMKNQMINISTVKHFAERWQICMLFNIKNMQFGYNIFALRNRFKNIPGIIVSSGPSLDKNIEDLKAAKGNAFIICAYSALQPLLNHNIHPDLVVTIDSYQLRLPLPKLDIPIYFQSCSNANAVHHFSEKRIFGLTPDDAFMSTFHSDIDIEPGEVPIGSSVASTSLSIANIAGCNPIIFVGQDMAFTNDKFHASGTYKDVINTNKVRETGVFYIDDIYGNKVLTDDLFCMYRLWFEYFISQTKQTHYIDATEGGAFIKGTEILTLAETIDKYCPPIPDHTIEQIFAAFYQKGALYTAEQRVKVKAKYEKLYKKTEQLNSILDANLKEADKLVKLYKYTEQPDPKKLQKILSKLDQIDDCVNEFQADITLFNNYFRKAIFEINLLKSPGEQEGLYIARKNRLTYRTLKEACEFTLPRLKRVLIALEDEDVASWLPPKQKQGNL